MYIEIKEGKLSQYAPWEFINSVFVDIDYSTFNPEECDYTTGIPVKISDTPEYLDQQAKIREDAFKENFFEITGFGWYRKKPNGYSSAIESLNTAFNAVSILGSLPAGSLIFYTAPDFTDPEQCNDEWLVENQVRNEVMTASQFGLFYKSFIEAWNHQEH